MAWYNLFFVFAFAFIFGFALWAMFMRTTNPEEWRKFMKETEERREKDRERMKHAATGAMKGAVLIAKILGRK